MFFAIAEDDERVVLLAGFLECLDGEADGGGEVRAAERRPGFIDLFDGLAHGPVIDGERRVNIGAAGEADEADAFVGHGFQQFVDDAFSPG